MSGNVIDLQRYRAERQASAPAPQPVGMVMMMVPVFCVPVMMVPAGFISQQAAAPAS